MARNWSRPPTAGNHRSRRGAPGRPLRLLRSALLAALYTILGAALGGVGLYVYLLESRPDLCRWHVAELDEEYTIERRSDVRSFDDYLALEERLFRELRDEVYAGAGAATQKLNRFHEGSLADPTSYETNWNRSFELEPEAPRGGVLLIHGLSDSPYSLRSLGQMLHALGLHVVGLRMPGHGTAPSALLHATWQDMASAVELAAAHVARTVGPERPFAIIGYSMGAAQAVNYALAALEDRSLRSPDTLVLISPAIGVSAVAALAAWQSRLASVPGLKKVAWTDIGPEYDPYKYVSFTVNAGDQMYRLTLEIRSRISALRDAGATRHFPRTLAFLSVVDATVSTRAVVADLLDRVDNRGNELVLFDLDRREELVPLLASDPRAEVDALFERESLGFSITLLTNESPQSDAIIAVRRAAGSREITTGATSLAWPVGVYSLSHVALPFPPDDPIYGSEPPSGEGLHLGSIESRGERGVLRVPASEILRLRYNPFYSFLEDRLCAFLEL